ncbi:MAG: oligosaccharide flippase family protein [Bacteroidota bacterium]
MREYKKLVGQTLIYGLGTIIPRFLNYLVLTPVYTRLFEPESYGIITEIYAYIVVLLILLTYGLETGVFRFAQDYNRDKVFSTALCSVLSTSFIFVVLVFIFKDNIAGFIGYEDKAVYVKWFALIVAFDAVTAIYFARLRLQEKALKFSIIKIINVFIIIVGVAFFYFILPEVSPDNVRYNINGRVSVDYVFIINLLASGTIMIIMFFDTIKIKLHFDFDLLKKILRYSYPLLIAGMAGALNDTIDRILFKHLVPVEEAMFLLGIYGANYKLAVVMTLFIQMYKYAVEPFFFDKMKMNSAKLYYAEITKFFIIITWIIFLAVILYLDIFKFLIDKDYHAGLKIVPVILLANIMLGIFYNLSFWYKVTNLTRYGALITITGACITILLNIFLIPRFGYIGAAWTHLACYTCMVLFSYFLSRKFYRVNYDLFNIFIYSLLALGLFFAKSFVVFYNDVLQYGVYTLIFVLYIGFVFKREKVLKRFF